MVGGGWVERGVEWRRGFEAESMVVKYWRGLWSDMTGSDSCATSNIPMEVVVYNSPQVGSVKPASRFEIRHIVRLSHRRLHMLLVL